MKAMAGRITQDFSKSMVTLQKQDVKVFVKITTLVQNYWLKKASTLLSFSYLLS